MTFGEKLQKLRKAKGLSQGQLAAQIIGSIIFCLSAVGLLVIGILSSVYPVVSSYAKAGADGENVRTYVKTGLQAFLELHNIGWLFALCIILVLVGIGIVIYPKVLPKVSSAGKTVN